MTKVADPSLYWAVLARPRGEVLTAEAQSPGLHLGLLGVPPGLEASHAESWLYDVLGVAHESCAGAPASRPPTLLQHALTGLLFSHGELWDRPDAPRPCSFAFVHTVHDVGFGWVGEAEVTLWVDGEPREVECVAVRDQAGREARAWSISSDHSVQVRLLWSASPEAGAEVEAVWSAAPSDGGDEAPVAAAIVETAPQVDADVAPVGGVPLEAAMAPPGEPDVVSVEATGSVEGEGSADASAAPPRREGGSAIARWLRRGFSWLASKRGPRVDAPAPPPTELDVPVAGEGVEFAPGSAPSAGALDDAEADVEVVEVPASPAVVGAGVDAEAAVVPETPPTPAHELIPPTPEPESVTRSAVPAPPVPVTPMGPRVWRGVPERIPQTPEPAELTERARPWSDAPDPHVIELPPPSQRLIASAAVIAPTPPAIAPPKAPAPVPTPIVSAPAPEVVAPAPAALSPAPTAVPPVHVPPEAKALPTAYAPVPIPTAIVPPAPVAPEPAPPAAVAPPVTMAPEPVPMPAAVAPPAPATVPPASAPPAITPPSNAAPASAPEAQAVPERAPREEPAVPIGIPEPEPTVRARRGPRAPQRPAWPSAQQLAQRPTPIWRRPWAWAVAVVVLFAGGWMVGAMQDDGRPRDAGNRGALATALRAVGLGGPRFTVNVNSRPPGAWIAVDGKTLALRTPAVVEVPPGEHSIGLSFPDLGGANYTVRGLKGDRVPLDATLWGTLEIFSPNEVGLINVSVDGEMRGYAPLRVDSLTPGVHEVRFSGPGISSWGQTVDIHVGETKELLAHAPASPASGVLQVQASFTDEQGTQPLKGAQVFIDGQLRGVTPLTLDLPRGPHSVRLVNKGQQAPIQVIDLPGGNQRFAVFELGLDLDVPQLIVELPPKLPRDRPVVVSASLAGVAPAEVREMWLHAQMADGPWRRYPMTLLKAQGGVAGVVVFPSTAFDEQGRARYYLSAQSRQGDESFTELRTVQLDRGAGR